MAYEYKTRWVPQADALELINLYHLARTALAGTRPGRWERMQWAVKWYSKSHPQYSHMAVYKDLDGLLA